jgi:hypothetical protein
VTWRDYEDDLEAQLVDLHVRVHRGGYQPLTWRRKYIAEAEERHRQLGIAAMRKRSSSVRWWRCSEMTTTFG